MAQYENDIDQQTARIDYESNDFVVNSLALLQQIREQQEVSVFTDDIDELLVQEVQQKRVLWDTSCRGYKDNNKKNMAWKEISNKLHKEGSYLYLFD